MDINTLRVIGVVLGALAFLGICWWAFSPKRKKRFEEDAKLPFADEELSERSARKAGEKKESGTPAKQNTRQDDK
ncbi:MULTISPECIES: cbb3-type cytochrome oxidase subunit 3 [Microbulbifer]|uniref:Cytochrome c oxidase cbb3-type subunit 4 n=1 Tax=Microbulbifer rhizosphaerae TaxID=1562603 RepID=A0A7W4WEW3_9GAMM|nr:MULTISPECIES: cbb3-type cytochrome c oxidase subunit 3 [unclassified Microbulbifer]MBB3062957.1 cytochrome c oxidase cbb3-type subunit 4 [Microbulbifer rhizosphaerae]